MLRVSRNISYIDKILTSYRKEFFTKHWSMITISRNVSDQDKQLTSYTKNIFCQTLIHTYY